MSIISQKLKLLPNSPGVYIFYTKSGEILYVGKATSLRDRVGSYFDLTPSPSPYKGEGGRSRPIEIMIDEVRDIKIKKTDTVLEAYLLEQDLIKKLQPKYNVDGKDDKSFSYIIVTKEEFPRFVILRKTDLENLKSQNSKRKTTAQNLKLYKKIPNTKYQIRATKIYGPYTSKKQIEVALKILRKIFPYHARSQKTEKGCLESQIGLCPGPYDKAITKQDYAKNIRGIKIILEGKKKSLIAKMKKEMEKYSQKQEFEKAADMRNKIFALQHIQDIAIISKGDDEFKIQNSKLKNLRVEGYDISNISGSHAVGSMVVFDSSKENLEPNKNEYRKFKIKTIEGANDVGAMREVLIRRFQNNWEKPNLIVLDGGAGHLNMARKILRTFHLDIPIMAVAKGPKRKKLDLRSFGSVPVLPKDIIEQIRDESHRFAISYHRKLRSKNSLK